MIQWKYQIIMKIDKKRRHLTIDSDQKLKSKEHNKIVKLALVINNSNFQRIQLYYLGHKWLNNVKTNLRTYLNAIIMIIIIINIY